MDDPLFHSVRPVIIQGLDVLCQIPVRTTSYAHVGGKKSDLHIQMVDLSALTRPDHLHLPSVVVP